jgi:hypothetical protein
MIEFIINVILYFALLKFLYFKFIKKNCINCKKQFSQSNLFKKNNTDWLLCLPCYNYFSKYNIDTNLYKKIGSQNYFINLKTNPINLNDFDFEIE